MASTRVRVLFSILGLSLFTSAALPILLPGAQAAPTGLRTDELRTFHARAKVLSNDEIMFKQAGLKAQKVAEAFLSIQAADACAEIDPTGCIANQGARCIDGKWVLKTCVAGTECHVAPNTLGTGTVGACQRPADVVALYKKGGLDYDVTTKKISGLEVEEDSTTISTSITSSSRAGTVAATTVPSTLTGTITSTGTAASPTSDDESDATVTVTVSGTEESCSSTFISTATATNTPIATITDVSDPYETSISSVSSSSSAITSVISKSISSFATASPSVTTSVTATASAAPVVHVTVTIHETITRTTQATVQETATVEETATVIVVPTPKSTSTSEDSETESETESETSTTSSTTTRSSTIATPTTSPAPIIRTTIRIQNLSTFPATIFGSSSAAPEASPTASELEQVAGLRDIISSMSRYGLPSGMKTVYRTVTATAAVSSSTAF